MSTCTAPSAAAITLADPLSIAARSGGSTTSICASRSASPRPLVVVVVVVDAFVPNDSNVPSRVVARTASIASTIVRVFLRPARALDALERALDDVHRARWHLLDSLRESPPRVTVSRARRRALAIAARFAVSRVRARPRRGASRGVARRGVAVAESATAMSWRDNPSFGASRRAMSYFALTVVSANDVPIYARDFTAREDDGARAEVRPEGERVRANEGKNARRALGRLTTTTTTRETRAPLDAPMRELVVRAALDVVDERSWETNATYLRVVDRFNDVDAHAHCAPTRARMVLLTNGARGERRRGRGARIFRRRARGARDRDDESDARRGRRAGARVRRGGAVGGGAAVGRARARVKSAESDGV